MDLVIDESYKISQDGFCIATRPEIPTPAEDVEQIKVDGRDEELLIKKGFKNISYSVEINALEDSNVKPLIRKVKAHLLDAATIYFSDDPEVCYKVKNVTVDSIQNVVDFQTDFKVNFELNPFQYIRNVKPITVTSTSTIMNPGTYFSLPKFTIYGDGEVHIRVNDEDIYMNSVDASVVLDSDLMEAYSLTVNMNPRMTGNFPKLRVGANTMQIISGATRIVIDEPRWRYR